MRVIFLIIFIVLCSLLSGIDVAGSIYEDTVWSPENNPYHVVGDITVEEGAKLTIEPGVLVMMKSMMMYDHDDFLNNALIVLQIIQEYLCAWRTGDDWHGNRQHPIYQGY